MRNNRLVALVRWSAVVALAGCISSKQYTLKLDPSNAQNNQLCERSNRDLPDQKAECHPVASGTLDGPATLAVELDNADPARVYTAHLEQTTQSSGSQVPQALIAEVFGRFSGFVKAVGGTPKTGDAGGSLLTPEATSNLAQGLRTAGFNDAAGSVVALGQASAPPPAPPGLVISTEWYAKKTDKAAAHFVDNKAVIANDPNVSDSSNKPLFGVAWSVPPGRDRAFPKDAVDQLIAKDFARSTAADELAAHVVDVCSDFGTEPYDGKATPWAAFLDGFKLESLKGPDVLHDIGIDASKLGDYIRGKNPSVTKALEDARIAAIRAFETGGHPTPAQQVIHMLYATSRLYSDASVCAQNIEFVTAIAKDAKLKAPLAAARDNANHLITSAKAGRDLFHAFLDPLVTRSVIDALTAGGATHVSFGSISLRPGKVNVSVADNATQPKQVASYEFQVANSGIAVSVGPMIAACPGCFQTVTEGIEPGETGAGVRTLRRNRQSFGTAIATLVQFPLVSRKWFELGPCIGIPLDDITGSNQAVLAGVSVGHRAGISLSLGVQLFGARRLKPEYGNVVDTSRPGLATATPDSVTDPSYSAAFFMSLNITTALLGRAGSGGASE